MTISIHIAADNPDELVGYLALLRGETRPQPLDLLDAGEPGDQFAGETVVAVFPSHEAVVHEAVVQEDKPKRGRGRPRKVTPEAPEVSQEAPEFTETETETETETGTPTETNPFAAEAADAGPRDPKVDWGLALELLRAVYERPGASKAVNNVLTEYAVTKFTSIPKAKGTELLGRARALDEEFPAT
jgi:hypothetical protein